MLVLYAYLVYIYLKKNTKHSSNHSTAASSVALRQRLLKQRRRATRTTASRITAACQRIICLDGKTGQNMFDSDMGLSYSSMCLCSRGAAGGSLRSDAPSVQSHPWPHRCGGLNTRVTAVTEGFRSRVYEHRERRFAAKRCGIPASMVSMHVRTANPADV